MFDIKKILIPVDFADCSRKAVETALELAVKYGGSVTILHTWIMPEYVSPSLAVSFGSGSSEALEQYAHREAEGQLAEFMEKIKKPAGVRISLSITYGLAHETILERARDHDLVVMGTHGRRGIAHFFLGSVAEKVIRQCEKPVLIVNAFQPTIL